MKDINEFIKTEKGKKIFDDMLQKYIEEARIRNENIIDMLSNETYMNWLINFTNESMGFTDNDWLYRKDEISEFDLNNVKKLYILYDILEDYAEKNNIEATPCDFGNLYNFIYNDICFEIGIMVGQGTLFFASRKEFNKELTYINYNDIKLNKEKQLVK